MLHQQTDGTPPRTSPAQRIRSTLRWCFGRLMVGVAALGAFALIGLFTLVIDQPAAGPGVSPLPVPQVLTILARETDVLRTTERYVGRVEPAQTTAIAFERPGTVLRVAVDEGDHVAQGDLIANLDTRALDARQRELRARLDAARADVELADVTLDRTERLKDRGFAALQAYDEARLTLMSRRARIAELEASLLAVEVDLDKSSIRAPYDGRVAARDIDTGATVSAGTRVVTLIEDARPQLRVGLPQSRGGELSMGQTVAVEMNGRPTTGKVATIRPDVDGATQTIVVLVDLDPRDVPHFGGTARLTLDRERPLRGFWLPSTALREGADGLWTVMVVAAEPGGSGPVSTEVVEILAAAGEEVFVRGTLVDGQHVISEGRHRVTPEAVVRIAVDRAEG